MLIIIFLLITLNKVSPYLITEKVFSQQISYVKMNYVSLYNSYNSYYSNNFVYSNAFNSGSFFCSNSKYISYSFYSYNSIKSSSHYITQVGSLSQTYSNMYSISYSPTVMPTAIIAPTTSPTTYIFTIFPTKSPTPLLTLAPTYIPTLIPTLMPTYSPTHSPTLVSTTAAPTPLLTLAPTQAPVASTLTFETAITLSGFSQPVIDNNSLNAIILSIAKSANISSNYVSIKEYSFVNGRRRLDIMLQNLYNLLFISQFNIPLTSSIVNPSSLYTSLTNNIQTSISSGAFVSYLLTLNTSISSMNLTISNYTMSQMNIVYNVPTSAPTIIIDGLVVPKLGLIEVIKIVFISMAGFIAFLFVFMLIIKKVNKYNINNITNINNSVNHNEISISV